MTYCKEFSALLDPYIDGELSPGGNRPGAGASAYL